MESLGDAYTGSRFEGRDPRRVYAGAALVAVGVLAIVAAIVVGTGSVNGLVGADGVIEAQGIAGVVAGLAIPSLMIGVVVVLPASRRERLGVLAGTVLCLGGVWLFTQSYPHSWTDGANQMAFPTMLTYFAGGSLAFWFVFTAIAEFHVRNNPTDEVSLELKRQGETKTVQLSRQEYQHYRKAIRGDGGHTEQVIRELESRFED
jgi:hypothetical protein